MSEQIGPGASCCYCGGEYGQHGDGCPNAKTCAHCWHDTGFCLTSCPVQWPQVCCYCGSNRVRTEDMPQPPPGHGLYLPRMGVVIPR